MTGKVGSSLVCGGNSGNDSSPSGLEITTEYVIKDDIEVSICNMKTSINMSEDALVGSMNEVLFLSEASGQKGKLAFHSTWLLAVSV